MNKKTRLVFVGFCFLLLTLMSIASGQVDMDTESVGDSLVVELGGVGDTSYFVVRDGNALDALNVSDDGDTLISGVLTMDDNIDMDFNDIDNINDLDVDNDVDIGNDLHVADKIEHLGDSDTYFDFNANQILFFAGGVEILDMITTLAKFGVDVDLDDNDLLNANLSDYSGINVNWYNDKFNVDLNGTTYTANTIELVEGTLDSGNISSINISYDGDWYNISEENNKDFMVYVNFTGVSTFNDILIRWWYEGGKGHEIKVGLWDFDDSAYEEEYGDITDTSGFVFSVFNVLDPERHISGGDVYLRLRHDNEGDKGRPDHDLHIDHVSLLQGLSATTISEHDALSGRDGKDNHPWAMPTDASRNFTGNVTVEDNMSVAWLFTAYALFGDGGNLTNISGADGYGGHLGHPHDQDVNTSDDVVFNSVSGDGSGLTGIVGDGYGGHLGHPHDQDVNTTDNVVFADVTATDDMYVADKLYHYGDTDTYIGFVTDYMNFYSGNILMLRMLEGGTDYVVFNEDSNDVNFRVEGASDTQLFNLDAGLDMIGISKTPAVMFDVGGDLNVDREITGVKQTLDCANARSTAIGPGGSHYMSPGGGITFSAAKGWVMIRDGSITGVSIMYDVTAQAGSYDLELRVSVNGASVWANDISETTGAQKTARFTQSRDTDSFSAGNDVTVYLYNGGAIGSSVTVNDMIVCLEFYTD